MTCTLVQSADYSTYIVAFVSTIFAIGAYFSKNYIFDPIRSFRAVCWRADGEFSYYQNVLCNDVQTAITDEALSAMRQLSVDLKVAYKQIPEPARNTVGKIRVFQVPNVNDIGRVCAELIGMSNRKPDSDNSDLIAAMRVQLRTEAPPPSR